MGRKRLDVNIKKVSLNLSITKQIVDEYKLFCKNNGEHISPRIERLMIEDMKNNYEGN